MAGTAPATPKGPYRAALDVGTSLNRPTHAHSIARYQHRRQVPATASMHSDQEPNDAHLRPPCLNSACWKDLLHNMDSPVITVRLIYRTDQRQLKPLNARGHRIVPNYLGHTFCADSAVAVRRLGAERARPRGSSHRTQVANCATLLRQQEVEPTFAR
jgi:hypothetical protein